MDADRGTGPAPRDRGLQPERTHLAWRRSTLALTVVVLLTLRLALRQGGIAVLGSLTVVGWIAVIIFSHHRWRADGQPRAGLIGPEMPLFALVTAGCSILGVILILSSLG